MQSVLQHSPFFFRTHTKQEKNEGVSSYIETQTLPPVSV